MKMYSMIAMRKTRIVRMNTDNELITDGEFDSFDEPDEIDSKFLTGKDYFIEYFKEKNTPKHKRYTKKKRRKRR